MSFHRVVWRATGSEKFFVYNESIKRKQDLTIIVKEDEIIRKGLTEVVFILDRSGSMRGLEEDTIGGFNSDD